MSDLFRQRQCGAAQRCDVVDLKFGSYNAVLYYQSTFKIASAILMAAKLAGRHEGVELRKWLDFVRTEHFNPVKPTHFEYRRSGITPNVHAWDVAFEGNLVVIKLDDTTIKLHFADAFELYTMLRLAAKDAKAWAGDTSRYWNTRAMLTDAEDDDKILYA